MIVIKMYKVKTIFNKLPEISRKIKINLQKFPEMFCPKFPNAQPLIHLHLWHIVHNFSATLTKNHIKMIL